MLRKNSDKRTARNGNEYLAITLGDKSGQVTSMIWDINDDIENLYRSGNVVYVSGMVGEYQGKRQLNINSVSLAETLDDIDSLIETAPHSEAEMYEHITTIIGSLNNVVLKEITLTLLERYRDQFVQYPAAKMNHHAYRGGLAYHTLSMLRIGTRLCKLYQEEIDPNLLLSIIALHDLMKIKEYNVNEAEGIGVVGGAEFSFEGKMKGHISMISEEIHALAIELGYEGREEVLLLQNGVLSHHTGYRSSAEFGPIYGSPVTGGSIEAVLVNQIDLTDSIID